MPKTVTTTIGHANKTREISYQVPDNEPGLWGADYDFSVLNKQHIRRLDAVEKVTGKAKYSYDINFDNLLHTEFVTCPYAHARVNSVDTGAAEKMPGVHAIEKFMENGTARHAGWFIALVAAETPQQAKDAARMVKVDYKELPFVVDMEETVEEYAPRIRQGGNTSEYQTRGSGDIDKGFQEADVIHEATYSTQVQSHCCLEPHGCVAKWDGDQLTVWHSTQGIWSVKNGIADGVQTDAKNVRVITQYMGGGFGSKFGPESFGIMAAVIAKKTGRPVKCMLPRDLEHIQGGNKPAAKMYVKIGAKNDGTLTAIYVKADVMPGHTGGGSIAQPFSLYYDCPNVKVEERNVYVNAGGARAFRAPGHPQGSFGLEMALEELAMKLDMDPYELKSKNVGWSELDARKYEFELGAEKFAWGSKYKKHGSQTGRFRKGVGCAVTYWHYTGSPGGASVRCTIFNDGTAEVANGTQDLGTGHRTMMAAVSAEELGVEVKNIKISIGDTDLGLNGPASGGSTTTPTVAPAVRSACYRAKQLLFVKVAAKWNIDKNDIESKNNEVFSKSDSNKRMSWKDACALIRNDTIVAHGEHVEPPKIDGVKISSPPRGAQFVEVTVDTETGKVKCDRVVAVQDVGKTMTKTQTESQICGGVIQGVAYALYEERLMDKMTGRQINPNMEDYKFLGSLEMPEIEPVIVDVYDPVNCAGAKGLGEPPHIPTAAAIGCAVANAIGVPVRSLPVTPAKILAALEEKEG